MSGTDPTYLFLIVSQQLAACQPPNAAFYTIAETASRVPMLTQVRKLPPVKATASKLTVGSPSTEPVSNAGSDMLVDVESRAKSLLAARAIPMASDSEVLPKGELRSERNDTDVAQKVICLAVDNKSILRV